MADISDYAATQLLAALLNEAGNGTVPAFGGLVTVPTLYCALSASAILKTDTATGINEPSGVDYVDYARVLITAAPGEWNLVSPGLYDNLKAITFATAGTGTTGFTATHYAFTTAASGDGDIIFFGQLTTQRIINVGIQPIFAISDLTVTLA